MQIPGAQAWQGWPLWSEVVPAGVLVLSDLSPIASHCAWATVIIRRQNREGPEGSSSERDPKTYDEAQGF